MKNTIETVKLAEARHTIVVKAPSDLPQEQRYQVLKMLVDAAGQQPTSSPFLIVDLPDNWTYEVIQSVDQIRLDKPG